MVPPITRSNTQKNVKKRFFNEKEMMFLMNLFIGGRSIV
jgi:hypothetical protein